MTSSAEVIKIALLALVTGAVLPLLVQLFLTLRALRLTAEGVDKRVERILDNVNAMTEQITARASAPSALGATLAAAVPAVVAAVQAFRTSFHHDADASASDAPPDIKPTREPDEPKERSHAQRKM